MKKHFISIALLFLLIILGIKAENSVTRYAAYDEYDITDISPAGWLQNWFTIQKHGYTGHIDSVGYPFNTGMWKVKIKVLPEGNPFWWPYEQTAYWIDGAARCGYFLGDNELINKADDQIRYVFDNPRETGELGPKHFTDDKWAHVVFFRAVMAKYMATKDQAILDAMVKHYNATADQYLTGFRNYFNIEILCWLYGKTGNKEMLDLAVKIFKNFEQEEHITLSRMLSDTIPHDHGVTYLENIKIPAILYAYTGEDKYLEASINAYRKIDRYHMLIDGIQSSVEQLQGKLPHMAHETCDISDFIWSTGYMLMITGDAKWGDKLERAFYNAGFGAVSKDFTSHQYYSAPNQFIADLRSSHWDCAHDWFNQRRKGSQAYLAAHTPECCTGNLNRIAPNYCSRMWLKDADKGITAALYGPSTLTTTVGKGQHEVTIQQKTNYPFSEEILFEIKSDQKTTFPFHFRIPGWCKKARIFINGQEIKQDLEPGTFATIEREFKPNDIIKLSLPMDLYLATLPYNGVAVERGPIVYSMPIKAKRTKLEDDKSSSIFTSWEMQPDTTWQYALDLAQPELNSKVEIIHDPMPENPWIMETTPIKLKVPAYEVYNWDLFKDRYTPILPSTLEITEEKQITLVPLGTTFLRLTIFPDMKKRHALEQRNIIKQGQ